jgi:hypothetical protein
VYCLWWSQRRQEGGGREKEGEDERVGRARAAGPAGTVSNVQCVEFCFTFWTIFSNICVFSHPLDTACLQLPDCHGFSRLKEYRFPLFLLVLLLLFHPLTHTHSHPLARALAQIYLDFEVFAVLKIQEQRRIASQKVEVDSPLFVNAFRAWQQVRAHAHTRFVSGVEIFLVLVYLLHFYVCCMECLFFFVLSVFV